MGIRRTRAPLGVLFPLLLLISSPLASAFSDEKQPCRLSLRYTFERGDTLSEILQALDVVPLYGPRGSVVRTVLRQPRKFSSKKFGDVRAGTEVILDVTTCPNSDVWIIQDGSLLKRSKVEGEPAPIREEIQATPDPAPAPKSIPTPTADETPQAEVPQAEVPQAEVTPTLIPTPMPIVEPVKEIVPPLRKIEGEVNDASVNDLLNL